MVDLLDARHELDNGKFNWHHRDGFKSKLGWQRSEIQPKSAHFSPQEGI
jgi:hypothetical protein